jgi:hypothetical protein
VFLHSGESGRRRGSGRFLLAFGCGVAVLPHVTRNGFRHGREPRERRATCVLTRPAVFVSMASQ